RSRLINDLSFVRYQACIKANTTVCDVRNCEFLTPAEISVEAGSKTVIMDNCLHVGRLAMNVQNPDFGQVGLEVRLTRNTLVIRDAGMIHFGIGRGPLEQEPA